MASLSFFRELGLFIEPGFLDAAACARIRREMREASSEEALVVESRNDRWGIVLDRDYKKALVMRVPESTRAMVERKILGLKPRLEKHFDRPLKGIQPPVFLRYDEGGFAKAHRDVPTPARAAVIPVAAIVLLNGPAEKPSADGFGGGALRFYGLLDDPAWKNAAFSPDAEEGMLIAFPTDMLHEVQKVTFGQRFTIAIWFEA